MSTFLSSSTTDEDQSKLGLGVQAETLGPVAGVLTIAVAVSGLIDDSGLFAHPWWAVLVASTAVVGLLIGARTVRILLDTPSSNP